MTPDGPSMWLLPFMYSPWKCNEVDWFPSWLLRLITTRSPTLQSILGMGHFPLIPMTGLSNAPSGLPLTQLTLKSCVTIAADAKLATAAKTAANRGRPAISEILADCANAGAEGEECNGDSWSESPEVTANEGKQNKKKSNRNCTWCRSLKKVLR